MRTTVIRPARRFGAVVTSLALLTTGCVGPGQVETSPPAGSAGSPPPSAASPSPSPSPSAEPSTLPEGLAAKTWVTLEPVGSLGAAVAGTLDGRYHLTLPPDEVGLTAADGRIVSVVWTKAPDGSIERSTIVVRDLRQEGAEVARFVVSDAIVDAAIRDDHLYLSGNLASPGVIGGVYAGSLADGRVRTLIEPGPPPANLGPSAGSVVLALQTGPGVSRGPLVLSPSGRTFGSAVCGNGRCNIELVDPADGTTIRRIDGTPGGLWFVTDTTVVTVEYARFGAVDLAGNRR